MMKLHAKNYICGYVMVSCLLAGIISCLFAWWVLEDSGSILRWLFVFAS